MACFLDPDQSSRSLFVLSERFAAGTQVWRAHRYAQLVCVSEGIITLRTKQGLWVLPPQRAVWVLPGMKHSIVSSRPGELYRLYVDPALVTLPKWCGVVAVEPLLQELLIEVSQIGSDYAVGSPQERLIRVALDRLPMLPMVRVLPLQLPDPNDTRLRRITEGLTNDPSDARPLSEWARTSGLTERTAERLFHVELGMTFGAWRQQLRLLVALERLAMGETVTNVALDVGYSNVSAFIAMFKSAVGVSPAHYFRRRMVTTMKTKVLETKSLRSTG